MKIQNIKISYIYEYINKQKNPTILKSKISATNGFPSELFQLLKKDITQKLLFLQGGLKRLLPIQIK